MVRRILNISKASSFFLFGARGTGKSTLLKQLFPPQSTLKVDLLLPHEFDRLVRKPESLIDQVRALPKGSWVILDEVQKIPQLLDLVHHSIEEYGIKFAMSGSSARKLRRGGANLLAGRAFVYHLFPLTHPELGSTFDISSALNFGTLPGIYEFSDPQDRIEFLTAYAHSYLREEIIAEQAVRILPPFRKFIEVAAQMNGQPLNYAGIARDVGVDDKTVKSYFGILEDTLVGFFLEPYHRSVRKTQTESPRFYFFDTGVKRAIEGTLTSKIVPRTYAWGKAFEHFVIAECIRLNSYRRCNFRFYFLRTQAGLEIDLIVERPDLPPVLIEIKSEEEVGAPDIKHLHAISAEFSECETMLFSCDPVKKKIGNTICLPWIDGIRALGLAS